MIYKQILKERQRLDALIKSIQKQLSDLPDGKLICSGNGTHYKWYYKPDTPDKISKNKPDNLIINNNTIDTLKPGNERKYIAKKFRSFAEQLALKKYLSCLLNETICEKRAIDFYLKHHSKTPPKSSQLLTDHPGYRELLSAHFKPLSEELAAWTEETFESNPKYPEKRIHKSISGNMLRSKSESLIDMLLYLNKIPFRYECALQLGNTTIYPDFTIRHPQTGQIYYWEHFGLMDDIIYQKKVVSKLQAYMAHGIIPSIQLITTYETNKVPLTSDTIEKILHNYFIS